MLRDPFEGIEVIEGSGHRHHALTMLRPTTTYMRWHCNPLTSRVCPLHLCSDPFSGTRRHCVIRRSRAVQEASHESDPIMVISRLEATKLSQCMVRVTCESFGYKVQVQILGDLDKKLSAAFVSSASEDPRTLPKKPLSLSRTAKSRPVFVQLFLRLTLEPHGIKPRVFNVFLLITLHLVSPLPWI